MFLNPWIFWTGLALASVPIIIHILNRQRFKIRYWAAMKFLLEAVRKNRRRLQIEELILLALRTLAIVLLALAIGRFTGCSAMDKIPGGANKSQTVLFVLDDSPSMGQKLGSSSVFSSATADLIEEIKALADGDQLAILLTSQEEGAEPFQPMTIKKDVMVDSLVARLQGLKPSDVRARLADPKDKESGALGLAAVLLQKDVSGGSRRLVILSDFRKEDLREQAEGTRRQFAVFKQMRVKVVAMDYGREARNNLTVENMELLDKFAVTKQPARVRLTVRNNGPTGVRNIEVRVKCRYPSGKDLKEIAAPMLKIDAVEPGQSRPVEFSISPPQAGSCVVTAELPADEMEADNVGQLALDVREAIRVLVVDGKYNVANPLASESYFFIRSIDPNSNGSYGNRPDVVTMEALGDVSLDDYDLVVMMNVVRFPMGVAEDGSNEKFPLLANLERYVRSGGGLAIFTGDAVDVQFYGPQGRFYNNGLGLLPIPLAVPTDHKDIEFFRLDPKSFAADPMLTIFQKYREQGQDPTSRIRFHEFSPAGETTSAATSQAFKVPTVLARFNDPKNSPAIISRQYDQGTVVLFCTSASLRWNDWPIDESGTYIAVTNDMLTSLARGLPRDRNLIVGHPIDYELPSQLREARATLKTPQFPAVALVSLPPQVVDRRNMLIYPRPVAAGVYWLTLTMPDGKERSVLFTRNLDPAEGELTPGHQADVTASLGNESDYAYVDRTSPGVTHNPGQRGDTKEYWIWALGAMLLVLAAETFLGQRFGHYST